VIPRGLCVPLKDLDGKEKKSCGVARAPENKEATNRRAIIHVTKRRAWHCSGLLSSFLVLTSGRVDMNAAWGHLRMAGHSDTWIDGCNAVHANGDSHRSLLMSLRQILLTRG